MLKNIQRYAVLSLLLLSPSVWAVGWTGQTLEGQKCSGKNQSFGPWDFFEVDEESDPSYVDGRWWEAKNVHGKPGISALNETPMTQVSYNLAAAEFDYLLRAYPNHPEILSATIELEIRRRRADRRIKKYPTPPECYIQRAAMFRPMQAHIKQLMGIYLHRLGKPAEAIPHYQAALALDSDLSEVHYNAGLAYASVGNYEQALQHAHVAYRLGYPLPGLKRKLVRAGHWRPIDVEQQTSVTTRK